MTMGPVGFYEILQLAGEAVNDDLPLIGGEVCDGHLAL